MSSAGPLFGGGIISREEDLWALLKELESSPLPRWADVPPIHIKGWNPTLLYFPTEPIGHSLSPSLARAVAGYHNNLSRAFSYAAYGQEDGRLLKAADRDALDLRMLVTDGSNGLKVLDDALERLTHALLTKMSSRQMSALILIFLLLNFGETTMKSWLHEEYAAKAHDVDEATALKLSEEETERMKIMASVLDRNPPLKPVAALADDAKIPLLRGTLPYDRSEILGVPITRDQAQSIVSKERDKGQSKRLDGRFEVVEIDIENEDGYMGTLRDAKTGQEIRVSINRGDLPEADTQTMFNALRQKSTVAAMINAWVIGDKIHSAFVVRADPAAP